MFSFQQRLSEPGFSVICIYTWLFDASVCNFQL